MLLPSSSLAPKPATREKERERERMEKELGLFIEKDTLYMRLYVMLNLYD